MNRQILKTDEDEEKARKILEAFQRLDRQERARRRLDSLVWILTLVLMVALAVVFISHLRKFQIFQNLLTQPDSLLLNQP